MGCGERGGKSYQEQDPLPLGQWGTVCLGHAVEVEAAADQFGFGHGERLRHLRGGVGQAAEPQTSLWELCVMRVVDEAGGEHSVRKGQEPGLKVL